MTYLFRTTKGDHTIHAKRYKEALRKFREVSSENILSVQVIYENA